MNEEYYKEQITIEDISKKLVRGILALMRDIQFKEYKNDELYKIINDMAKKVVFDLNEIKLENEVTNKL